MRLVRYTGVIGLPGKLVPQVTGYNTIQYIICLKLQEFAVRGARQSGYRHNLGLKDGFSVGA